MKLRNSLIPLPNWAYPIFGLMLLIFFLGSWYLVGYWLPEKLVWAEAVDRFDQTMLKPEDVYSRRGQLGDSFGMFTSLMGTLSIFGILLSLREQRNFARDETRRAIQERYLQHVNEFWSPEFLRIRNEADFIQQFFLDLEPIVSELQPILSHNGNGNLDEIIQIKCTSGLTHTFPIIEIVALKESYGLFKKSVKNWLSSDFNLITQIRIDLLTLFLAARKIGYANFSTNYLPDFDEKDQIAWIDSRLRSFSLVIFKLSLTMNEFIVGKPFLQDLLLNQHATWMKSAEKLIEYAGMKDDPPPWFEVYKQYDAANSAHAKQ
jgi:hypothetical protein